MVQDLRKPSLYDEDFYTWTNEQAQLLRDRKFQDVDLDNVIEEIETLGRSEGSALRSSLRLLVVHMLKLTHQPENATNSWQGTVVRERNNAEHLLEENPGLKAKLPDLFAKACDDARREAIAETGISPYDVPENPEFTLEQVRDETFMPNATLFYTGRSIRPSGLAPAIEGSRMTDPPDEEEDEPSSRSSCGAFIEPPVWSRSHWKQAEGTLAGSSRGRLGKSPCGAGLYPSRPASRGPGRGRVRSRGGLDAGHAGQALRPRAGHRRP